VTIRTRDPHGGTVNDVRRLRRALDLTQAQLAQRIGISRQALIAIEAGNDPALRTALRLSRALGVDVATLFHGHAAAVDQAHGTHVRQTRSTCRLQPSLQPDILSRMTRPTA
jgi:putative transcriptional regulator